MAPKSQEKVKQIAPMSKKVLQRVPVELQRLILDAQGLIFNLNLSTFWISGDTFSILFPPAFHTKTTFKACMFTRRAGGRAPP